MKGTQSQIEWAKQLRPLVGAEFDRVADALKAIAGRRTGRRQADIHVIIAILEEKRAEVMTHEDAGYFIREWQERNGQVRRLISKDPRYLTIKTNRGA